MKVSRSTCAIAGLLAAASVLLVACSGSLGTGGTPTTTDPPLPAEEMCTLGRSAFAQIETFDRKQVDEYMGKVKKEIEPLGARPPTEIAEDMKAWVDYVLRATTPEELANLPADYRVSTKRIDEWWKANCGTALIGGN